MKSSKPTALEILVVDDDRIVSLLHKNELKSAKIEQPLVFFRNGKEALEYLEKKANSNLIFLILLDLNMPCLNGWEFLDYLQSRNDLPETHVVVVTSSIFEKDENKVQHYQRVVGFYHKPLKAADVQEIRNLEHLKVFFEATEPPEKNVKK